MTFATFAQAQPPRLLSRRSAPPPRARASATAPPPLAALRSLCRELGELERGDSRPGPGLPPQAAGRRAAATAGCCGAAGEGGRGSQGSAASPRPRSAALELEEVGAQAAPAAAAAAAQPAGSAAARPQLRVSQSRPRIERRRQDRAGKAWAGAARPRRRAGRARGAAAASRAGSCSARAARAARVAAQRRRSRIADYVDGWVCWRALVSAKGHARHVSKEIGSTAAAECHSAEAGAARGSSALPRLRTFLNGRRAVSMLAEGRHRREGFKPCRHARRALRCYLYLDPPRPLLPVAAAAALVAGGVCAAVACVVGQVVCYLALRSHRGLW
jgi:hypothetical protein